MLGELMEMGIRYQFTLQEIKFQGDHSDSRQSPIPLICIITYKLMLAGKDGFGLKPNGEFFLFAQKKKGGESFHFLLLGFKKLVSENHGGG